MLSRKIPLRSQCRQSCQDKLFGSRAVAAITGGGVISHYTHNKALTIIENTSKVYDGTALFRNEQKPLPSGSIPPGMYPVPCRMEAKEGVGL
jgi:hypothetical protein